MTEIPHDSGFAEVADRCWVARHSWLDLNVGVVGGERGLLVVDSHASAADARRVAGWLRALPGEVVGVVNTHEHFDHTFGNGVLGRDVAVYAHETAAARTVEAGEAARRSFDPDDPHWADVQATTVVAATHTFSSVRVVDLGDRVVELLHLGRGHTGGDAVVRVGDAGVTFAGDLVEESGHGSVPGFGDDCYPLEWPATLDLLISLLGESDVVVPGHGTPVRRAFVEEQRECVGVVAETVRGLALRGVPVSQALGSAPWPYPVELLGDAVRRGYAQLPRAGRSLPLA
ncbi:MAG: MBL fold metallo-hydrolase [Nocardioidaceae bacterium]